MKLLRLSYKIIIFIFISLLIGILGLYTNAFFEGPIKLNAVGTYTMYDSENNIVFEGSSNSKWTNYNDISPDLINAVVSVEDKNFFKHSGFDVIRIIKALYNNTKNKRIIEGGSTISQQYIKNAYLDFKQTWDRKLKEAIMTINLETHYTKEQILEAYLNTINYGNGNYGITSAAKYYFNKKPKELSMEESLILAGIPKNPSNYNPISSYDNAIKRAKIVALTMYNNKKISTDEYNNLFQNKIEIKSMEKSDNLQMINYFNDAVLKELKTLPGISDELIASGKLKVYSTLDYDAQKIMEQNILNKFQDSNELQVASVIINPKNGEVRALTGGINYNKSEFNRALYSKRQVGSAMKPFLYYAALKNGMTSSSKFLSQYTTFNLDNGKTYSPKNYNNVYPNDEITMAAAVAYSDNIYAVKTNLFLGVNEMINVAKTAGIKENLKEVTSLALGTSEINLLDFANGYTTFASGGYKKDIHLIRKVEDSNNNILYEYEEKNNLVLNPNYVYILNELLTSTTSINFKDYNTPTELSIAGLLSSKYAIKTGTTDTDHWEVGYNPDNLVMLWIGYDDNRELESSNTVKSKKLWASIMEQTKKESTWYQMPKNVIGIPQNSINGQFNPPANKTNIFYYLKGSEPTT